MISSRSSVFNIFKYTYIEIDTYLVIFANVFCKFLYVDLQIRNVSCARFEHWKWWLCQEKYRLLMFSVTKLKSFKFSVTKVISFDIMFK